MKVIVIINVFVQYINNKFRVFSIWYMYSFLQLKKYGNIKMKM